MTRPCAKPSDAAARLGQTELLRGLGAAALAGIARVADWWVLPGGEALFQQGDAGDALYLVASGRLRVEVEEGGSRRIVCEVGPGGTVGELALLTCQPRSATVRAVRDSLLARLSRGHFESLLARRPRAAVALTRLLAEWVIRSNRRRNAGAEVRSTALVPAGGGPSLIPLAAELAGALGRFGRTAWIAAWHLPEPLRAAAEGAGGKAPPDPRIVQWLSDREQEARFTVYVGDAGHPGWTACCLRQADRTLLAVPADQAPGVAAASLPAGGADLLVLHPAQGEAQPAAPERLPPLCRRLLHHRAGSSADRERLARLLAGRAVGLALGGGGARGFGHIGVLRACAELGIPVDRLAGASMGGVIAAQAALGWTPDRMEAENARAWSRVGPAACLTVPLLALAADRPFAQLLTGLFGDRRIEELWLPYLCVSTSLSRAATVVHRTGPLARALRASIALPGILAPVVGEGGELLADGGLLANLPTCQLAELGDGPVIAVNVSRSRPLAAGPGQRQAPSAWRMLRDHFLPRRRPPFPGIFEVLYRTALLASDRFAERDAEGADLVLDLPLERFGAFRFGACREIARAGYAAARAPLARWWETAREGVAGQP